MWCMRIWRMWCKRSHDKLQISLLLKGALFTRPESVTQLLWEVVRGKIQPHKIVSRYKDVLPGKITNSGESQIRYYNG